MLSLKEEKMEKLIIVALMLFGVSHALVIEYSQNDAVVEDETDIVLKLINTPIQPSRYRGEGYSKLWGPESRLKSFSWSDCGGSSSSIQSVSVSPDPLQLPGSITIGFKLGINTTIDRPLQGNLLLEKKLASVYVKIPCIDNFGSCTYDGICNILDPVVCPDEFNKAGVPCKCPFKQGSYNLPSFSFDVDANIVPAGDYRVTGKLLGNSQTLACLQLILTVSD